MTVLGPGGLPTPSRARGRRALLSAFLVVGALVLAGCGGEGGEAGEALVVSGVVVDAAGRPVPDARVAFTAAPTEVADTAALTGIDGRFVLSVPMTGSYRVAASTDTGRAESTVDVDGGRPDEVRLVLQP